MKYMHTHIENVHKFTHKAITMFAVCEEFAVNLTKTFQKIVYYYMNNLKYKIKL